MNFHYDNIPAPWLGSYGEVPFHLNYPEISMSGAVYATAAAEPDFPALSFFCAFLYNFANIVIIT